MNSLDVIDLLLGESAAMSVRDLRAQKPELATQVQDYYDAVFVPVPDSASSLPVAERWMIAIRTASHTGSDSAVAWYSAQASKAGLAESSIRAAAAVGVLWPGDPRMSAIMRHVDLIVARPVESRQEDIETLTAAGLSPGGIVVLSQVVAYVSYQVRLVAALRAIGATA